MIDPRTSTYVVCIAKNKVVYSFVYCFRLKAHFDLKRSDKVSLEYKLDTCEIQC